MKVVPTIVAALAMGTVAALLIQGGRENASLQQEIDRQRNHAESVRHDQNTARAAVAVASSEKKRRDLQEYARLSKEADRLEKEITELRAVRADSAPPTPVSLIPLPGMTPIGDMQNVGRDTPTNAWQTLQWAMAKRDWPAVQDAYACEVKDSAALEALFAEISAEERVRFGTPERMATALTLGDHPPTEHDLAGVTPQSVSTERLISPDDAELLVRRQVSADKISDGTLLRARRFPDGWRLLLPPISVEQLRLKLDSMPPTQRLLTGRR